MPTVRYLLLHNYLIFLATLWGLYCNHSFIDRETLWYHNASQAVCPMTWVSWFFVHLRQTKTKSDGTYGPHEGKWEGNLRSHLYASSSSRLEFCFRLWNFIVPFSLILPGNIWAYVQEFFSTLNDSGLPQGAGDGGRTDSSEWIGTLLLLEVDAPTSWTVDQRENCA